MHDDDYPYEAEAGHEESEREEFEFDDVDGIEDIWE